MVVDLLEKPFRDKIAFKANPKKNDNTLCHPFIDKNSAVCYLKFVKINGIEFRNNLLVSMKDHKNKLFPTYGIIKDIIDIDGEVHFLLRSCKTVDYDSFLQAYKVVELQADQFVHIGEIFQYTTFSFWTPCNCNDQFVSRRCFNQDY